MALGDGQEVDRESIGGCRIEVLRRLVEDEDGELGQQGAGHRHPLALPAREAGAGRPDVGGQAGGQTVEPLAQANPFQRLRQLLVTRRTAPHA